VGGVTQGPWPVSRRAAGDTWVVSRKVPGRYRCRRPGRTGRRADASRAAIPAACWKNVPRPPATGFWRAYPPTRPPPLCLSKRWRWRGGRFA